VHRFTAGAVPASALRPDLWARPQDVPIRDVPATEIGSAPVARSAKERAR
jgi:hypothetical protein